MPAAIPLAIALGTAGGTIGGAALSSRASGKAAKTQANAATEAAHIQDESTQRAEQFARQQAQQQWSSAEADRKANYDQWAAKQQALNAFRQKNGFDPVNIPGYVASQDPGFLQGGAAAPPTNYMGPKADSWRTQPGQPQPVQTQRPPMQAMGGYLPPQAYAPPTGGGDLPSVAPYTPYRRSMGDYLSR